MASQTYVRSDGDQLEDELIALHSQLVKDLNARYGGLYLFPDRRTREAMIKWRIRLEEFIETADIEYVTQYIPQNVNPVWWIKQSIYRR